MQQILFASTNAGKVKEMQELGTRYGLTILDPASLIASCGPVPDVAEGVASYRENARLKAEAFYRWSKLPCLADDTGLEVDALQGAPGIKSARFAGDTATMTENKRLLLEKLRGVTRRTARFRCVLCVVGLGSDPLWAEEVLEGSIAASESGSAGFGYDTLFILPENGRSLSEEKEHAVVETHRAKAFRRLTDLLSKLG